MSPRLRYTLLIVLLLAGYYYMAVSASRTESTTFDEAVHVTAGYNAWKLHDHRFDPGNGDFLKRWATLPLLFSSPNFPPLDSENWRTAEFYLFSRDLFFHAGNDPDSILLQARSMAALIGVALGLLVFACSRRLFGDAGALVSVTLFAFCPNMLANGALVSTDLTLATMLLASTWCLWRLLHAVTWTNLLLSLLAFSLLVISKMTAVLIAPIAVILIVARFFNREPWLWSLRKKMSLATRGRQSVALLALFLLHCLVGWGAIWTVFDFKYLARGNPADVTLTLPRPPPGSEVHGVASQLADFCYRTHVLPEGFVNGMEQLLGTSQRRPSFMNGHWKAGGQIWFFPYAIWVKTPPALFCLLALGALGWASTSKAKIPTDARARPGARGALYHSIPLFVLVAVYATVVMRQGLNIGIRHMLIVYPVFHILAGSVALSFPSRRRAVEIAVALLVGWFAIDSLAVRPHYLAYFSRVAGGPSQGYRRLADSSLDWGQDLPGLKRWLAAHDPDDLEPVFFSYFGTGVPEYYHIASNRLPGFPDWREHEVFACTPGYYAISATMFQNLYTRVFGPWNRVYENEYQATLHNLGLAESAAGDTTALFNVLQQHPEPFWQEQYGMLEKLRFNRLCGWLRATQRPPDDTVGYSILIWKLDAHDLHEALWAPPLELYDSPAIKQAPTHPAN
ncbi:MAG TPA: glycosyltransferase family 39 protein [Opitutaceae bacterium]|nr:glycosyltransferase family 39 protein [Opitutaceae bacterium]